MMQPVLRRWERSLIGLSFGLCLIFVGVLLFGFGYEQIYNNRVYPGIKALGVDLGGQSVGEAQVLLNAKANQLLSRQLTLRFDDGTVAATTGNDLHYSIDTAMLAQAAIEQGREGDVVSRWLKMVTVRMNGVVLAADLATTTSETNQALDSLLKTHERAVKDASFSLKDDHFEITPAVNGYRVDRASLQRQLAAVMPSASVSVIDVTGQYLSPTVTDSQLRVALNQANQATSSSVKLDIHEQNKEIDRQTLIKWLTPTIDKGNVTLTWNQDQITQFVTDLAKQTNKTMKQRTLNAKTGAVIEEGTLGYSLDQTAAITIITKALNDRLTQATGGDSIKLSVNEVAITDKQVEAGGTAGLYPGKYIEVDLSEQQLYQFEGETLVATYTVSTGKWSTPTPTGTMYVFNHIERAYSREYNLYMPWWMALARTPDGEGLDGYGIHELPEWPNGAKEGENHLGTPVSHGCIRLGVGPAEWIYQWADSGTPVVIHK